MKQSATLPQNVFLKMKLSSQPSQSIEPRWSLQGIQWSAEETSFVWRAFCLSLLRTNNLQNSWYVDCMCLLFNWLKITSALNTALCWLCYSGAVHTKPKEISLWKHMKCFTSTLRGRNLKTQQSTIILNLCLREIRSGNSHGYQDAMVFENRRLQNVFRSPENDKPAFSNSFGQRAFPKSLFSWRISVDDRPNRRNIAAFSNSSGLVQKRQDFSMS